MASLMPLLSVYILLQASIALDAVAPNSMISALSSQLKASGLDENGLMRVVGHIDEVSKIFHDIMSQSPFIRDSVTEARRTNAYVRAGLSLIDNQVPDMTDILAISAGQVPNPISAVSDIMAKKLFDLRLEGINKGIAFASLPVAINLLMGTHVRYTHGYHLNTDKYTVLNNKDVPMNKDGMDFFDFTLHNLPNVIQLYNKFKSGSLDGPLLLKTLEYLDFDSYKVNSISRNGGAISEQEVDNVLATFEKVFPTLKGEHFDYDKFNMIGESGILHLMENIAKLFRIVDGNYKTH